MILNNFMHISYIYMHIYIFCINLLIININICVNINQFFNHLKHICIYNFLYIKRL